jgi:hypothetical protein
MYNGGNMCLRMIIGVGTAEQWKGGRKDTAD